MASLPKTGELVAASLVRQGDYISPIIVRLRDAFNNSLQEWQDLLLDFSVDAPAELGGVVHVAYEVNGVVSSKLELFGPVGTATQLRVKLTSPTLESLSGATLSTPITIAPPCPEESVAGKRDAQGASFFSVTFWHEMDMMPLAASFARPATRQSAMTVSSHLQALSFPSCAGLAECRCLPGVVCLCFRALLRH